VTQSAQGICNPAHRSPLTYAQNRRNVEKDNYTKLQRLNASTRQIFCAEDRVEFHPLASPWVNKAKLFADTFFKKKGGDCQAPKTSELRTCAQVMLLLNEPVDPPRPRGPLDLVNGSRGVEIAWDHLPPLLNRELENGGVMLKGENGKPQDSAYVSRRQQTSAYFSNRHSLKTHSGSVPQLSREASSSRSFQQEDLSQGHMCAAAGAAQTYVGSHSPQSSGCHARVHANRPFRMLCQRAGLSIVFDSVQMASR
jgi:hypothetical protein